MKRYQGFKYETHLHTADASACGRSTGEQLARAYKENGYTGIIITDHFFNGNSTVSENLPWKERVRQLMLGYNRAQKEGERIDLDVFFGWEYSYHGTDFLTYGLDAKFLFSHPDILSWELKRYFQVVTEHGGFISHAHPFREAPYINKIRLFPAWTRAVETINLSNADSFYNRKAIRYAEEHNLIQTAGSDAHGVEPFLGGGMVFERRLKDIHDFIGALCDGEKVRLMT